MASNILRVKATVRDNIDSVINAAKQAAGDGIYNTMVQVRDTIRPLTPYDEEHHGAGPHLNQPEIHRYDSGTCSLQWRANDNGYYYATIQNDDDNLHHPNGGQAGFADLAEELIAKAAPQAIAELFEAEG